MKTVFPKQENGGKTGRFCIKVLFPQFLREKTPLTHPKGYSKRSQKTGRFILFPTGKLEEIKQKRERPPYRTWRF